MAISLFFFVSASATNSMRQHNLADEVAKRATIEPKVAATSAYSPHLALQLYVAKYNRMQRDLFTSIKKEKKAALQTMGNIFRAHKLPEELKYLAIVESELKNKATSPVGAAGVWQLMPGTAMGLGLLVDSTIDERRHLSKSTRAAAKYLRDLNRSFNDWSLTVAAYNCGPGPVYKAIKKAGSRNYWELQQYLPRETRLHVKRLMATQVFFEGKSTLIQQPDLATDESTDQYHGALASK